MKEPTSVVIYTRAGTRPLAASLPPLTIADPIVAILIGAVVFDERLSDTGAAVVGQVFAFAVMTLATVQLARRSTVPAASSSL